MSFSDEPAPAEVVPPQPSFSGDDPAPTTAPSSEASIPVAAPTTPQQPDLFAPPADAWRPVSPKYTTTVRLSRLITNLVVFGALSTVSWFVFERWEVTLPIAVVGLLWTAWRVLRAKAWVDAWGYAERDQDLCIKRGLWTRQLTVVPFGRMQVVEVTSGPLLRLQGLANVKLVTAAALTGAEIPGLAHDDAVALRDRMIELSDARGAGL